MTARKLAVVAPDTRAPRKKPLTVEAAAATGDQRELLVAMRTRIAEAVGDPNTPRTRPSPPRQAGQSQRDYTTRTP